jgi:hypothetical protein
MSRLGGRPRLAVVVVVVVVVGVVVAVVVDVVVAAVDRYSNSIRAVAQK